MKIKHSLPKGQRIMKGKSKVKYNGRRIPVFIDVDCISEGYWWLEDSKKWATSEEVRESGECYSTHCERVYSVKAFRRRMKQWSKYLPKGTKFRLNSAYVGCDVIGTI